VNVLPDFIIGGAPKCGTTALWNFLNNVPDVCMATLKEPKFFTEIKGEMTTKISGDGPRTSGNFSKGFKWYSGLFKNCKPNQLLGEGTTLYFCNTDASEKIHNYIPNAKLIFMLRHPAERAYSHYWQEYKLGFDFPTFETMAETNHPRYRFYVNISHYKQHLERFFSFFKKEQILIVLLEDFRKCPAKEFERVVNFLELSKSSNQNINFKKEYNEQVMPVNRKLAKLYAVIQETSLLKALPSGLRKYLSKIRSKVVSQNSKPLNYTPLSMETRNHLNKIFQDDILYVQNLFNRDDLWLN
jgi:hypothetical protein